jgi:hypothetical protein
MDAESLGTHSGDDIDADGARCKDSEAYHKSDSCVHSYIHILVYIYALLSEDADQTSKKYNYS